MKQLILFADMEGASGIFESNAEACYPDEVYKKSDLWRTYGRRCITSDVLAVCNAALEYGIDEILLYDGHYAGCAEFNVILDELPKNVRVFDVPQRCFYWRRIRGQAAWEPFGIITVGQHARYGEPNAYFAHTIQTPPIKAFWVNGKHIAEIGSAVLNFQRTPYIANVGCAASHKEARELSENVSLITVKDKLRGWEPTCEETYPIIFNGVLNALRDHENKTPVQIEGRCECSLELVEPYYFEAPEHISWKGTFEKSKALWEAPYFEIASELFNEVRACIKKGEA